MLGFRVFSLPVTGSFQRSLAVLCAIGLYLCLALEVDAPYLHASYPRGTTRVQPLPFCIPLRVCHPLRNRVPADFESTVSGRRCTHISCIFRCTIQFALCRVQSPLLAASQLISLPVVTKTFQFTTFAILSDSSARSHSDIPGSIPACGSPGLCAACHILHSR